MKAVMRMLIFMVGVVFLVAVCSAAWVTWQTAPANAAAATRLRLATDLEWIKEAAADLRQINTLLVLVDQLPNRHPRLIGVWLVISDPQHQRLTWAPLFPLAPYGETQASSRLAVDFGLRANGELAQPFSAQVEQMAAPWQYTLIIDRQALGELAGVSAKEAASILRTMPWEDRAAATQEQADLFANLCQQAAPVAAELLQLENQLTDNLYQFSKSGKASPPALSLLQADQCRMLHPQYSRPAEVDPSAEDAPVGDQSNYAARSANP